MHRTQNGQFAGIRCTGHLHLAPKIFFPQIKPTSIRQLLLGPSYPSPGRPPSAFGLYRFAHSVGCLAGLVGRMFDSSSHGPELEPHTGFDLYLE